MTRSPYWILHVDLDQFIAAVEVIRRPELRGRPVVVGGDGDPTRARQVVATASYQARAFGVRSGMPLRTAARRCPEAVFLPTDQPAYEAASARVMAVLRGFPVAVEVYGWDEAFLGAHTDDPERLARAIQQAVTGATGLSCTVGIGDTRQRAKLATGFGKPAGVYRLTGANWSEVMGQRPTGALWGVGPRLGQRLVGLGVHTVTQLAAADPAVLAGEFGPTIGPWLRQLGRGGDDSAVVTEPRQPRSRSRETTFPADLTDWAQVRGWVDRLARELADGAAAEHRPVARVAVKVRYAPYFTRIRIATLRAGPTLAPDAVAQAALALLAERFEPDRPVRLLGVRVEFAPPAGPPVVGRSG